MKNRVVADGSSRRIALLLGILIAAAVPAPAQDGEAPAGFEFVVGPRVGASYVLLKPDQFTSQVAKMYPDTTYFPVYTLFGITLEQRILLGTTRSHFAFQELVLIGGLEQSIALPMGAVLVGYRDFSGFEIGVGPLVNISGVGVVAAIGWTLSLSGVYVPIDISVTLPSSKRAASVSLTTGFNFRVGHREARRT